MFNNVGMYKYLRFKFENTYGTERHKIQVEWLTLQKWLYM